MLGCDDAFVELDEVLTESCGMVAPPPELAPAAPPDGELVEDEGVVLVDDEGAVVVVVLEDDGELAVEDVFVDPLWVVVVEPLVELEPELPDGLLVLDGALELGAPPPNMPVIKPILGELRYQRRTSARSALSESCGGWLAPLKCLDCHADR